MDERLHAGGPRVTLLDMSRTLRPGVLVVRRDDGHLQVGVDPPRRVVLREAPDVRRVLASLVRGEPPAPGGATARVVAALTAADLLVDLPAPRPRGSSPATGAAWARHGDDAARRLAARAAATVSLDAPRDVADHLAPLLAGSGLRVTGAGQGDVHLAVSHGTLARDRLDPCLRAGVPHLPVAGHEGAYVVGPFVLPGVTGCLRCDDARRAEADPRRAVVLEQLARAAPPAGDPVLLALALAWAVRDLLAWLEGDRPSTWGAAYSLGAGDPVGTPVPRHPHCGCSWADFVPARAG